MKVIYEQWMQKSILHMITLIILFLIFFLPCLSSLIMFILKLQLPSSCLSGENPKLEALINLGTTLHKLMKDRIQKFLSEKTVIQVKFIFDMQQLYTEPVSLLCYSYIVTISLFLAFDDVCTCTSYRLPIIDDRNYSMSSLFSHSFITSVTH